MTPADARRHQFDRSGAFVTEECLVVLFVDDDEEVLAALRTALHRLRRTYTCYYATGAQRALEILAVEPVDVVVTDVRMPGMSGLELLDRVRTTHPGIIRYVLSGEAESSLVLEAAAVAHRWLSKPCDRIELVAALAAAVRQRVLIVDDDVRAALGSVAALRSGPLTRERLSGMLAEPEVAVSEVAELIRGDPAMAAKVLQLAGAMLPRDHRGADLDSILDHMGLAWVAEMASSPELVAHDLPAMEIPGFDSYAFAEHVSLVGALAGRLTHPDQAELAYLGGVLSGIGLLIEAECLPDRLAGAYAHADARSCSLVEVERDLYGLAHPALAAHLLSLWGVPPELVELVAASHDSPSPGGAVPLDPQEAVRVARLLAHDANHGRQIGAPHLDRLGDELESAVKRWSEAAGSDQEADR